jgi:hypothetical protein
MNTIPEIHLSGPWEIHMAKTQSLVDPDGGVSFLKSPSGGMVASQGSPTIKRNGL